MTEQIKTITIDNVVYDIDSLPQDIINSLGVYQVFVADQQQQRIALTKTDLALRALVAEIKAAIETAGIQPSAPVTE